MAEKKMKHHSSAVFIKDNGQKFIDDRKSEMLHLETIDTIKNMKHIKYLSKRGHKVRKGHWTQAEVTFLNKNFAKYAKANKIKDPNKLLNCKSDRKMKETIRNTNFRSVVCRNLNRSSSSIYYKLKYGLMCYGKGGRFTEEEDKQLKHLVRIHGRNFVKIASIMKRNSYSVGARYRFTQKENRLTGRWSEKEENQLLFGLKTVMETNDLASLRHHSDIKWVEVSKFVKTRNDVQCRMHFMHIKKFKLQSSLSIIHQWTKQHTIILLNNLYDINSNDENDIDWTELNKLFTGVCPSGEYLRHTFSRLKYKIEDFNRKTFEEIIEDMREKYCK